MVLSVVPSNVEVVMGIKVRADLLSRILLLRDPVLKFWI